jgi:hypothetical protein
LLQDNIFGAVKFQRPFSILHTGWAVTCWPRTWETDMARKPKTEKRDYFKWAGGVGSFVALVISGLSYYNSIQSDKRKDESLGFTSNFTFECPVEFDSALLSLCWFVTITNQSDSKTSIVIVQASDNSDNKKSFASGFPVIEDSKGVSVGLPLVLDGGEAHQYLVRVPIRVPEAVTAQAAKMPKGSSLKALQHALLDSNLDLVGNQIDVRFSDEEKLHAIVSWTHGMHLAVGNVHFMTGRSKLFVATVTYPQVFNID